MPPLVLNDNPTTLVQITMQGSVGLGGANHPADVQLIQSMLNNLPAQNGGPDTPLAVDGWIGPLTTGAITRFQRAARMRVVDGRIDPLGPTIRALGPILNARGLLPTIAGIGPVDRRIRQALYGGNVGATTATPRPPHHLRSRLQTQTANPVTAPAPGAPTPVTGGPSLFAATDWTFASSSGVAIGVDIFGIAAMHFYMVKDSRPGFVRNFPWSGIGAGLSVMPVGLDVSFADMPSFGLRVRQGPVRGCNPMPEDDFQGPCTVLSVGVSAGVGWSGTVCFFGSLGPLVLTSNAVGAITGMEAGIPGAGIMGYWGITGRAE